MWKTQSLYQSGGALMADEGGDARALVPDERRVVAAQPRAQLAKARTMFTSCSHGQRRWFAAIATAWEVARIRRENFRLTLVEPQVGGT